MYSLVAALAIALFTTIGNPGEASAHHLEGCPQLIIQTFGETAHAACSVSYCETRTRPWYVYSTGSRGEKGWFQIHPIHGANSSYDPETNVRFAYQMSRGGYDWSQWSCKPWGPF